MSKTKKKRGMSIAVKLVFLAIVPAIITISGLLGFTVYSLKTGLEEESMSGMQILANSVVSSYSSIKGDYYMDGTKMCKGDSKLNIVPSALDAYVEDLEAQTQVILYYEQTVALTTAMDGNGARMTESEYNMSDKVWKALESGEVYETTNEKIGGKTYCGVYIPLKNSDGTVAGAVFAGEVSSTITDFVAKKVMNMLFIAIGILAVVVVVAFFIARSFARPIKESSKALAIVSEGNLNVSINKGILKRKDELGDMAHSLDQLVEKLREIVGGLMESAETVNESGNRIDEMASQSSVAANEISNAVEEIARGAVSQAEDIETATSEVLSMGQEISKIVNNVVDLTNTSKRMEDAGDASSRTMSELSAAVQRTTDAVNRIAKQIENTNIAVERIGSAASLIADIASQTSLLSLNASIESARAGEAGKGFAVVATEIQKLSNQSDETANQIQEIITVLQTESKETLAIMNETEVLIKEQYDKLLATQTRFDEVSDGINVSRDGTMVIKNNAGICDNARTKVEDVISNLSAISEENAASTEETTSSMQELNANLNMLAEMANQIKEVSVKLNEDMHFFKM